LNWRALDGAVGTEDTAVPGFWPKHRVAGGALVEVDAGIGGHELFAGSTAVRAREYGAQDWSGRRVHGVWLCSPAFDMRGGRKQAKLACGRPLDGRVGRHASEASLLFTSVRSASHWLVLLWN